MFSKAETSLEQRLSWTLSLLLLGVLIALLAIAAWIGQNAAIQFALSRLHHDAESIITSLDWQKRQIIRAQSPIYQQPLSGHYYRVVFEDGVELHSRSLWDQNMIMPNLDGRSYWITSGPRGQKLLVWQNHYSKGKHRFTIIIAEDIAPLLSALKRFIWIGLIASFAVFIFMLLLQRSLIRRLFAQLEQTQAEIKAVREGRLEALSEQVPLEIQPLVSEFNQLLKAWKQHQERSRNALGNLAHALKTPLQLLLQAEGAQVQKQVQRMNYLIEKELKRARITGRTVVGQYFNPGPDIQDLVETILTLYHHKSLRIQTQIEADQPLPLDQNDLIELIGNLLDNAAKWAQRDIRLRLQADESLLQFCIEDDGPGIDQDKQAELWQRGTRLDENQPGHGLGLAIVRDTVELYQGKIQLARSDQLGGLKISIQLPLI